MVRSTARIRWGAAVAVMVTAAGTAMLAVPAAQAAATSEPIITLYAGHGPGSQPVNGPATATAFENPYAVALDPAGNLYVGDCGQTLSKISPAGQLTVLAGTGIRGPSTPGPGLLSDLACVSGVAVGPDGDVYFSDRDNHQIDKLSPGGILSVVAGSGATGIPTPGPALQSPLGGPDGLTFDAAGNLYVGDQSAHGLIYKITAAGQLVIVAGNGTYGPPVPGPALDSPLGFAGDNNNPGDVAVDAAGNLYLADGGNNVVEKVTANGILSILVGRGIDHPGPPTPGPAAASALHAPDGVSVDTAGNVYIADSVNNDVEKVTPLGTLSVIAGLGVERQPHFGYPAVTSGLDAPTDTVVSPDGVIYVADIFNWMIDRISAAVPAAPVDVTANPGDETAFLSLRLADAGSSAVTAYQVSLDGGRTWTALKTGADPDGTRSAHLTGLTDGRTYPVQVRAVNAAGPGSASATIPVTPVSGIVAPGAPTGVTVTADVQSLTVRWQAPAEVGSPALTGYAVTVLDQVTGAHWVHQVGPILETTVTGLTAGDPYTATVSATSADRIGPRSASSAPVIPTAAPVPPAPRPTLAPKASVRVSPLSVVGVRAARVPVTCRVSTGRLGGCAVVLAARVDGHRVVIGTASRRFAGAGVARRATVVVTLTRRGRLLASRIGGVSVRAAAAIRVPGRTRPLAATHRIRIVSSVTRDPQPLHFAPTSAELTPADRAELTGLRYQLGGVRVVVCAGYTDTVGDDPYNQRLGLARAKTVCAYLVAGTRLKAVAVSFGETQPAATNKTEAGRAANRRALVALDY